MTPEEVNRTIEFLLQHAATFSIQMQELAAHTQKLTKSTAQFQSWAAEVIALESKRLDEHDRLHQDAQAFQSEAIRLLHRILDRLPPAEH